MIKIEGSAHFKTPGQAADVLTALTALRHDDTNAIIGGSQALNADGDYPVVTVSYRLRPGISKATADKVEQQIAGILGADLTRGETEMDTEHVFNAGTGRVEPRQANKVVQVLEDGTTRVLTIREAVGNVTHPDTDEVIGQVPIREMFDQDGNKVRFDGPRGEPDPSVTVSKN